MRDAGGLWLDVRERCHLPSLLTSVARSTLDVECPVTGTTVQGRAAGSWVVRAPATPMGRALNTGPVDVPGLLGVPLLAWLACGLAAVSLSPRNLAAGALAATGVLWPTSWQLEHAGYQAWADLTFLVGLAGVVGLLLVFPTGRFVATWHRHVAVGFLVAAVAGPLASRSSVDAVAARRRGRGAQRAGCGCSSRWRCWC